MRYHKEIISADHLDEILQHCDSLRSGLARVALRALNEFIATFDLNDKQ